MEELNLNLYSGEQETACALIQGFWKAHNGYIQTKEAAKEDLQEWTKEGHAFYFIRKDGENVGFVHLGSRGGEIDWLEDLFVLPEYQNQGIGSKAIQLTEEIVKKYSASLYIEAAAKNEKAIRLYQRAGYNCLNTITIRKDFDESLFDVVRTEKVYDLEFEVRKIKK